MNQSAATEIETRGGTSPSASPRVSVRVAGRPGAPVEDAATRTVTKHEAARILGRSVQRVDQLRRMGQIRDAAPGPGNVVNLLAEDVEARLTHPSHGSRRPRVDGPTSEVDERTPMR